jgi:hypothetical protein
MVPVTPILGAAMKNFLEIRGQTGRVVFDPTTDQFAVEAAAHPFIDGVTVTGEPGAENIVPFSGRRMVKDYTAAQKLKQSRRS